MPYTETFIVLRRHQMVGKAVIVALTAAACLSLLLLPSVKNPATLLQANAKDLQAYKQATSKLGNELQQSHALAVKLAPTQANQRLMTQTNALSREARILSSLEDRVKRRAAVDHKEAVDEPLAIHSVEERANSKISTIKREKAVAHDMYLSAFKKLQLEQAKAKAMMQKGARQPHAGAAATPKAAAVWSKPAAAPVQPKAAGVAGKRGSGLVGQQGLSALYGTGLIKGEATVKHCAVEGGCGYPPAVGTHEHGAAPRKVRRGTECVPPSVKEGDKCVPDPRSAPLPQECREHPHSVDCMAWHHSQAQAAHKHAHDLRSTYHYRYKTHWFNPGHSHTLHPQRFPHKDGADLGDNYISGWEDSHKPGSGGGTFADHMSNADDLKTDTSLGLAPFVGGTDDLRAPPTTEHLKPPIAAMERRNPLYATFIHDDMVPVDHYKKVLWRYARRSRPQAQEDRFRGERGEGVLKGVADGRVDPLGISAGLADQRQPATAAFGRHKYLAYGRRLEKEPLADMALNGWHGQHGVPPMVQDDQAGPAAGPAAAGPGGPSCVPDPPSASAPHGTVCIDGMKFWRGKPKWCIRFCLPKNNPDAQYEYELLGHPPSQDDIDKMAATGLE